MGREGDVVYIVSDLVRGVSLSDFVKDHPFTYREAAQLCFKIAEAMQHAHDAGVIHRDLKPANLMIDLDGEPHIMDFGLAKREANEITMTIDGQVLGTPAYMSPEQARGDSHQADARSDIYSLGVILFQLLTGELPFRGTTAMLNYQVITQEAPSPRKLNGKLPRDLDTICLKCLEKDPSNRYASSQHLASDLNHFLRGEAIKARPISSVAQAWRWCRRKPIVATLLSCVALLLIVISVGGVSFAVTMLKNVTEQNSRKARLSNLCLNPIELTRGQVDLVDDLDNGSKVLKR